MRWLTQTSLVAVVAFVAALILHGRQVAVNATAFLHRADALEHEQNWSEASEILRRYLRLHPNDASIRVRLARVYDQGAHTPRQKLRSLQLHALALGMAPDEMDIQRRHLALLLEVGDHDQALQRADELLREYPDDVALLRTRALALYARYRIKTEKSLDVVRQALETVNEADPAQADVAVTLARVYRTELRQPSPSERNKMADAVLENLVEHSPRAAEAFLARYAYRKDFSLAGADDDLDQALIECNAAESDSGVLSRSESRQWSNAASDSRSRSGTRESFDRPAETFGIRTNSATGQLLQANHASAAGEEVQTGVYLAAGMRADDARDWEAAGNFYEQAIELAPSDARGYLLLGQSFRARGENEAALAAWERGLAACEWNDLKLEAQVAAGEIQLGRLDDAESMVEQMQKQIGRLYGVEQTEWFSVAYALRSEAAMARQDFAAAVPLLQKVLALRQGTLSNEKAAALAEVQRQLGACFGKLQLWDQAAVAYQNAAERQPRVAAWRLAAANAWENAGWLEEAVRHFESAISIDSEAPQPWASLATIRFRQQNLLPQSKRDWSEFEETLAKAHELQPASATLALLQAESELVRGQLERAERVLRSLEADVLDTPALAARLAVDYERLTLRDDADRIRQALVSSHPTSLTALLLGAELLYRRDRDDEAENLLIGGLPLLSDADRPWARYRLALLRLARGKTGEARAELEQLAHDAPNDVRPVQILAELALDAGDLEQVRSWEERLIELERVPGSTGWQFYRAQRLMSLAVQPQERGERNAHLRQANRLEKQLESLRPYWPPVYLLQARLAQLAARPDHDQAIAAYSHAIRLGENRIRVYQELISLLFNQNRIAEADAYLDRLREASAVPPELATLAMATDVRQGNLPRAVTVARAEVAREPENPLARMQLGQLLVLDLPENDAARTARLAEAEAELKKARELAPDDPRGWSALLAFYYNTKQTASAREMLARLERDGSLQPQDRPFVLAQAYALLGERELAGEFFVKAVEANPDRAAVHVQAARFFFSDEPDRSEKYLRRAIELAPNEGSAERILAMLLATRGRSEQDLEQVWPLLDRADDDGLVDPPNQRIKAMILLRYGGYRFRQRAQQVLESLLAQSGQAAPIDRLLLARLYEAQGQMSKAREQLKALVEREQPDPAHLAAYAEYLLRNGRDTGSDVRELGGIIDQLAMLEPEATHFRTLRLRARWLKREGRVADVPRLVAAFLEKQESHVEQARVAQLLLAAAGLYASLDLDREAEECYRRSLAIEPAGYPSLAVWLARRGRAHEAFEICRKPIDTDDTSRAVMALAAVLTVGKPKAEDRQAAEPIFTQALERHRDDRGLLFAVATFRLMEGDDDAAVRLLRRSLELDPRGVESLNNLAMLLGQRAATRKEALEHIERAIQIAGAQPELLDTKGWVMLQLENAAEAESLFQDALSAPPGNPRHRFHLAVAYQRQGKVDAARQALKRALDANLGAELLSPEERTELDQLEGSAEGE